MKSNRIPPAAKGEPAGCDRSRRGITGEQELVAQRLPLLRSSVPDQQGSGAGSRAPDGSPVADHRDSVQNTNRTRCEPTNSSEEPEKKTVGIRPGERVSFDKFKVVASDSLWAWWESQASGNEAGARFQVRDEHAATVPELHVDAQSDRHESDQFGQAEPRHQHPPAAPTPSTTIPFASGEMVFFEDRVELNGAVICGGRPSQTRRRVLDLLRKKRDDGNFVSYDGEQLAEVAEIRGGANSAAGVIRDLRDDIVNALQNEANVKCGRNDVILSGGPGYRFAECIRDHDGENAGSAEIGTSDAAVDDPNVPNRNVPNGYVPNVPDGAASERRTWILSRLDEGHRLKGPDVAKHFGCSKKTARRDLDALKKAGKVEFVGSPRTGFYRRRSQK